MRTRAEVQTDILAAELRVRELHGELDLVRASESNEERYMNDVGEAMDRRIDRMQAETSIGHTLGYISTDPTTRQAALREYRRIPPEVPRGSVRARFENWLDLQRTPVQECIHQISQTTNDIIHISTTIEHLKKQLENAKRRMAFQKTMLEIANKAEADLMATLPPKEKLDPR